MEREKTVKQLRFDHTGEVYELETFMTEREFNSLDRIEQAALPLGLGDRAPGPVDAAQQRMDVEHDD